MILLKQKKEIKEVLFLHAIRDIFTQNTFLLQNSIPQNIIITITRVELKNNNRLLTVYMNFFDTTLCKQAYDLIHKVIKVKKQIKYLLGKMVAKKTQFIPDINFEIENTFDLVKNTI